MARNDYMPTYVVSNNGQPGYNPLRPYYTPGLHHQHNYTSLPSSETIPGHTPEVFDNEGTPIKSATANFTSFAAFKYFMTMFTSPFDVGTTLLQVQYAPHESVEVFAFPEPATPLEQDSMEPNPTSHELGGATSSSEDEDEGFFRPRSRQQTESDKNSQWSRRSKPRRMRSTSDHGRSVYDDSSRPVYQMPPISGGVLDILGRIMKQPTEGWKSLFKGQRATWLYEVLWGITQPAVESLLNDMFGLYDDTIPLMHLESVAPNLITLVASHVIAGVLLSPLEIIRTRLIVQSASSLNCKYNGIVHAFRTMCREEGGVRGVYVSKNLPATILYHTIKPLLSSSIPIVIDRTFGLSASDSPVLYCMAEFVFTTTGLLITLPLETVRKRLHCQVASSPKNKPFETAVAVRPVHYKGVLDAVYKIMKEEGTLDKRVRKEKKEPMSALESSDEDDDFLPKKPLPTKSTTSAWGLRGLYRGFGMQLAANGMVFIFHAINGMDDDFNAFSF